APLALNTDGLQGALSPTASTPVAPKGRKRKGEDIDPPTDGKKRRAVKKPRDPNAPKRPPSSYIYYQNEIRAALKNKYPDITHSELLTRISQQWSKMTPEEKDSYEQKQAVAKAKYEQEKAVYDAGLVTKAAADEVVASSPALSPAVFPAKKPLPAPADADSSEENSSSGTEGEEEEEAGASSSSEDVARELAKPVVPDTPVPKLAKAKKAAPAPVVATPATKEKEKHPKEKKSAKKAKA
ncbi:hypothetical protein EWM64_g9284, partial [Hericium alpestre]